VTADRGPRLFFALWPSPAMQTALAVAAATAVMDVLSVGGSADAAANVAANAGASVRRVPAENFHLTLAFLGSVPLSRLAEVEQVADHFAQASSVLDLPIDITLDAIEHWRKPQVLVATASDTPPAAVALAEGLQRSLIDAGFSPDLKAFRVHATIARKVRRAGRELHLDPVRWSFDSLHLVQSQTHPDGSVYRPLKKWVLDKRD
jgi:RNA 2',3'-cyclic 3'-phosphodiesterase